MFLPVARLIMYIKTGGRNLPPALIGNLYPIRSFLVLYLLVLILNLYYNIILDSDLHAIHIGDTAGFLDLAVAVQR